MKEAAREGVRTHAHVIFLYERYSTYIYDILICFAFLFYVTHVLVGSTAIIIDQNKCVVIDYNIL
jgi:hypothetical protein